MRHVLVNLNIKFKGRKNKLATYREAYEASLDYFGGDELAAKTFVDKYALRDNEGNFEELTPDDTHRRLAREFARIENKYQNPMSEEEIFSLLEGYQFVVAQGSPTSAIGNPYQVQSAGNCFVIEPPYDSYGGILKADQELAQLMKRRAGVGLDISNIRPKGMVTQNAAKTTDGIAVFMERFSNTCREVAQLGRRGAEMQTLAVEHPEIRTFINIKKDKSKVTGANVSVRVSDEFMNAVKSKGKFKLRWPVDSTSPLFEEEVDALELWEELMKSAWDSAEPGVMFWSTVKRRSPADAYGEKYPIFSSTSSNPCQPGWATVLTPNGIKTMNDISIGDAIWSGSSWTRVLNKVYTGNKDVYAFRTRAGTFYGTDNHRVVSGGEKIEVKDADAIDVSVCNAVSQIKNISIQDVVDGMVLGDGSVHKASNNAVFLVVGEEDQDYLESEVADLIGENRQGVNPKYWDVRTTIQHYELPKTYERDIPCRFRFGDFSRVCGFLRGLYTANGSIVANRITLKSSSFKIIEAAQEMLASVGIRSYYTVNKEHDVEFSNGVYTCKESYDLNIGSLDSRRRFADLIGFIQKDKQQRLKQVLFGNGGRVKTSYEIVEKQFIGREPVYDITVEDQAHTYWTGGLLVSNCGEIVMGLDSCRLMAINLWSFVKDPFTSKSKFDFDNFAIVVQKAQRLMDDLIDLEIELIDKILAKIESDPEPQHIKKIEFDLWNGFKQSCVQGRRTGLGITALGDCLAGLGITYGSDKSVKMTEKIYKHLAINSYKSSCLLAKERGAFPIFDHKLEKNHEFIQQVVTADEELLKLYKKFGRRNIANLTTAPTGTLSIMTRTSSGIEPVFLTSYTRRKKVTPGDPDARVDFIDHMGDKWQEFTVYHHNFKKWMEVTGSNNVEESPYWKATSNDIDWVKSVEIQAAAQKWVCHAISKTANCPADTPVNTIKDMYMRAWESGCKGFTVYRDGCRTGVLVSNKVDSSGRPENITRTHAPKRPPVLPCDIYHGSVQGSPWVVVVGLLDGEPYELFGGPNNKTTIPKSAKHGFIRKAQATKNKNRYDLVFNYDSEEVVIEDVGTLFQNETYGAFTRVLSLSLRHGAAVQYIVEQLGKTDSEDLNSLSAILKRALKKYIKDGTIVSSGKGNCGRCGSANLRYQEGCPVCLDCSYTKCG